MEVLAAIREQKIEPPSKVVPGLTPIVDPIVMKALKRSPRQRFATAAEMRDEIEDLIQRAGVQIDSEAISREFASIYGDEIGQRALALKKAIVGTADVEELAKALGGTVLNPKQLPMMKGGVNDPDPLGLFSSSDIAVADVSSRSPVLVPNTSVANGAAHDDDFEIVDDEDDLLDMPDENLIEGIETPDVPDNRLVTGWDDSTSTAIPEDELLSMISEEDATIGFLPPQFAERFGKALREALDDEEGGPSFEDERTVGVPDATLSRLRAISSDESISEFGSPMLSALGAQLASSVQEPPTNSRPVPRAPSVLMEEEAARLRDRFGPRAPSWDMDANGVDEDAKPSAPLPGGPPPPPRRQASFGGSAVVIRDEHPAFQPDAKPAEPGIELRPPAPPAPVAPSLSDSGLDEPASMTDRAQAPLPFGTYSFTRGANQGNQAWGTPSPYEEPVRHPPVPADPAPFTTESSPLSNPGLKPEAPTPVDWAEPSPLPPAMIGDPRPEPQSTGSLPGAGADRRSAKSAEAPSRAVQISLSMLLILGLVLLVAGVALGALLVPQL